MNAKNTDDNQPPLSSFTLLTEERYRAFVANSAEGIWRCETETPIDIRLPEEEQINAFFQYGYLAECNDAFARMYGFDDADDLTGARLSDLLPREHPTNQAYLRAFIQANYRLSNAESAELDRNGNVRYIANSLTGVVENGFLVRAWGTQRDITAQREAETALRESEARFRLMADVAPVLMWTTNTEAKCDWLNKPWLDFTGRTMEQEIEEGWIQGIHPDDVAHFLKLYRAALQARTPFAIQYRLRRHDGEFRWLLDNGTPRYSEEEDRFLGFIGSCTDITDQKKAEEALLAVLAEKEHLTEAQRELLAQQRAFLKDVLLATTDGVLRLCDSADELPEPLPFVGELSGADDDINISAPTLRPFRHRVQAAAVTCGLPEERRYDLLTAVGEATMNVVVHASLGKGTGQVRGDIARGRVQVWITDTGPGITVHRIHRAVLERGFTTAGSLGHGFFLVLKTADRAFLLTQEGSGTTMVLEKDRVAPEPEWLNRPKM